MIRIATPNDFDFLYKCQKLFFAESDYGNMTWDEEKSKEVTRVLCGGDVFCLISEGKGFVAWTHDRYWTKEEVAHLFLFYIKKEFRSGRNALSLATAMNETLAKHNVSRCYASATGGFRDNGANEKAFVKLFKQLGFNAAGTTLIKEW